MEQTAEEKYRSAFRQERPKHTDDAEFAFRHPRMNLDRRAKIFSPFAALKGFEEEIDSKLEEYALGTEAAEEEQEGMTEMCCRYYMEESPELRPIVEAAQRSKLYRDHIGTVPRPLKIKGEVSPGDLVPVIATGRTGKKAVFPMIWGYHVEGLARPIINARSETAAEKATFRESWAMHRCVIPASWYMEWGRDPTENEKGRPRAKYAIAPKDERLTWLCGLYRLEEGYPHFVVLTRPPGESVSFLHDRMPLILPEEETDRWINPGINPHMLLQSALTEMTAEKIAS